MAFIVFEGGEGVGKSTQIELLFTSLKQKGISCTLTREPGGTPFAEDIRSLFKQVSSYQDSPLPLTELLLVSAARAQHIKKVIEPNIQKGNMVLCDRFLDSTYVYQCFVGKIDKKIVDDVSKIILQGLMPDLTFVLVGDTTKAMERISKENKREKDRLDSFHSELHAKIKEGYLEIINKQYPYPNKKIPKRVLIQADLPVEQVFSQIKNSFFKTLGISL